jgi:predicted sugar kinase
MLIEVGSPCSLPLGIVRTSAGQIQLLGVTLQHPPADVFAEATPTLSVTGPVAHLGRIAAERFLAHHQLPSHGNVEIELATPTMVGLSSEVMLSLSIARALAWVHGLPTDDALALARAVGLGPEHALEVWGFQQGGFLLADTQQLETAPRRQPVAHDDKRAWGFVLLLPPITSETPETIETTHLNMILAARDQISPETDRIINDELWPALRNDDLRGFGQALMALQQVNQAGLAAAGVPLRFTPQEQAVLDLLRDQGAFAWGRSLTGSALFGLVQGANQSVEVRRHLSKLVGIYGGRVMATITDNVGARQVIRDQRPIG